MNSAEYVDKLIADQKAAGTDLQTVAWNAALACVGWPYVFGARGEYCSPANRRKYYRDEHPTIKTSCKNFEGSGSCSGCKWYPNGQKVRCSDCRGFTYWVLLTVYGWKLMGAGATSQWNTETNWKAKGTVADGIPADTLVCLFVKKGKTMEHTGFGFNNETVECSSGVQHFTQRKAKWTDWGVPACIGGDVPVPTPTPTPTPEPTPKGYAIVTGKRVALRTAPTTQAGIILRVDTGKQVKLEEPPPEEWDYVSFQGKTGWMMKKFLKEGE